MDLPSAAFTTGMTFSAISSMDLRPSFSLSFYARI
jgi:hypothetical protein